MGDCAWRHAAGCEDVAVVAGRESVRDPAVVAIAVIGGLYYCESRVDVFVVWFRACPSVPILRYRR